jgi:hypothetical protein
MNINSPVYPSNSNGNSKKYSTSIVLNLDKYKVDMRFLYIFFHEFIIFTNKLNKVDAPTAPKKSNTFIANDVNKTKDTMNLGFGEVPKSVTRTGSTINSVCLTLNIFKRF